MRKRIALLGSGLAIVSLAILATIGCDLGRDAPTFFKTSGDYSFTCYTERNFERGALQIRFRDEGRRALVRFREQDAELTFTGGGLFSDTYANASLTLTIDPEARIAGSDRSLGPCQQD